MCEIDINILTVYSVLVVVYTTYCALQIIRLNITLQYKYVLGCAICVLG